MFSQSGNTQKCALCKGTEFYKEAGFYFCSKCQTQNENVREEVFETRYDPTTRLRKIKISSDKKTEETDIIGWTSWELYNFVLIGLTNELIEAGADPNIKLTTLQLWTYYLSKLEVAFTSKTKKLVPRMARRYHKKDAKIIYGKIQQRKKKKRKKQSSKSSASSMTSGLVSDGSTSTREIKKNKKLLVTSEYNKYLQSQESSDTDALSSLNQSLYSLKSSISQSSSTIARIRFSKKAKLETKKVTKMSQKIPYAKRVNYRKNHITTQYAIGPDVITPLKLWSIVYLALRINNQNILLSDMLRFGREAHLSYYKLDHLLPPEIALNKSDVNMLTQSVDITHKGLRRTVASVAKLLGVYEFAKPNFLNLVKRYCEDLELPRGIFLYSQKLFLSEPSIMNFTVKSSLLPNYEGRAIAYIIVVLKILFGLDDITEKEISQVIEKINRRGRERGILIDELFNFCEWQKYIECRKSVLVQLHYPSKLKYDTECVGTSELYLRFMGLIESKREAEPPENTNFKNMISQYLVNAMYQNIGRLNDNSVPMKEMEIFPPSLTPLRSYLTQILENPHYNVPNILKTNFFKSKVGYMTRPDFLVKLASQMRIKLEIIDQSIQYFEKIVPPFEQTKMLSFQELSELVEEETPFTSRNHNTRQSENLLDYSHRNRPSKLKLNLENLKHYSTVRNKFTELEETLDLQENNSFSKILSDGRLAIYDDSDSENEVVLGQSASDKTNQIDRTCSLNDAFFKTYNIKLYDHETKYLLTGKSPLKKPIIRLRDASGKFIKFLDRNLRASNKSLKKKQFKKIKNNTCSESSSDEKTSKSMSQTEKVELANTSQNSFEEEVVELPIDCFDLPDLDISILKESIVRCETSNDELLDELLFRPYKDYWMYHCNFSRVKGKNFDLFKKELPKNFLWLLNECAGIVEMTEEDLYEEVCLIEARHFNISKPRKSKVESDYEFYNCNSKSYINNVLNKW